MEGRRTTATGCDRSRPGRALAVVATALLAMAVAVVRAPGALGDATAGRPSLLPGGSGWRVSRVSFEPIRSPHEALTVPGIGTYRGAITLQRSGGGIEVVNRVGLEDYVLGIDEMPANWPAAALQAQAIAARTYGLWHVLVNQGSAAPAPADICATDQCQVYSGLASEQRPDGAAWAAAVAATARQVLLYHGRVIFAAYGSSDGGQTTSGGVPWLPSVPDPDDVLSPLHRWGWSAPLSSVAPALGVSSPDRLLALSGGSGGVSMEVGAPGARPQTSVISGRQLFSAFNANLAAPAGMPLPLPSDAFAVTTRNGQVVVSGAGWGNGLGMSQYGALGKALRGMSASSILAAYYGGVRPSTLSPDQIPPAVRVELADGLSSVEIGAPEPFRVVDGHGDQLAVLAQGEWRVQAAPGGGLDVLAPGAVAAPQLAVQSLTASSVRFAVSVPSIVAVELVRQGTASVSLPPRLVPAGTVVESLPGRSASGYKLAIQAYAGIGRVVTVPASFGTAAASGPAPPPPPGRGRRAGHYRERLAASPAGPGGSSAARGWAALGALVLLLASWSLVLVAARRIRWRLPG